jgi:hypothetical protein
VCHHYPVTEYGMRAISLILAYYNNKYLEIWWAQENWYECTLIK